VGIDPKPSLKDRLTALLEEYGKVALVTYFTLFGVVLVGFAIAISLGLSVDSSAGTAGTLGAAYIATKLTQPLRILATLVLTPIVAKVVEKFARKPPAA
jgi:ABC-type siderophore export system fused ATPase/permease subunit